MNNRIINLAAFGILAVLWLGFLAAMLINGAALVNLWQTFRGWPIFMQIVIGFLTLPVVAGLWIWQTTWPIWLRVILVLGLAWVTVYTFFPRKPAGKPDASPAEPSSLPGASR